MSEEFPIPGRLNLAIATVQLVALAGLLALAGAVDSSWALAGLVIGYALVMNSAYAMLHEAEHGLLHTNKRLNDFTGAVLALFFPAPFHLLRQGHIGHHLRNRSDDEAFDFYFDGESRVWKTLQLYGILTGFFYLAEVFGNLIALVHPGQRLREGARMLFAAEGQRLHAEVVGRHFHGRRTVRLWTDDGSSVRDAIEAIGHIPLPPYIKRSDEPKDRDRYQTVFARDRGSIAAPTA